jgi:DNA polymerase-3 subunit delta'
MASADAGPETVRYPWHAPLWTALQQQRERLAHALLLHGRPGLGKRAFALQLAQALLCETPHGAAACGQCHGCRLYAAGAHPDLAVLGLADGARNITVDQIRTLNDFLALRPHTAERKVVVIAPAEAMNLNAANALLKLLEEPPLGSMLLLVSSHPARLPATIRSRCSRLAFKVPLPPEAAAWLRSQPGGAEAEQLLALAGGAPLRAQSLAAAGFVEQRRQCLQDMAALAAGGADPVVCAARWKDFGTATCLTWLYGFVADLIKMQVAGSGGELLNPEARDLFLGQKNKYEIRLLYDFIDVINEYLRLLGGALEELLLLEDILIRWTRIRRLQ